MAGHTGPRTTAATALAAPSETVSQATLPSLNNFRDLGGTPCGASSEVRPGLLLRAASPADATEEDVNALLQRLPSLRLLDLRAPADSLEDEGPRLLADRTTNVDLLTKRVGKKRITKHILTDRLHKTLPMLPWQLLRLAPNDGVREFASRKLDARIRRFLDTIELVDVYWWILREQGSTLRKIIEDCGEAAGEQVPTIVHCAHGKDRTGIVIAILLHICGASPSDIAADYALSDEWGCSSQGQDVMLKAMPERFRERMREWASGGGVEGNASEPWAQFGRWCGAEADTMRALFERVERRYGSMDGYLDAIGVDAEARAKVAATLTCTA